MCGDFVCREILALDVVLNIFDPNLAVLNWLKSLSATLTLQSSFIVSQHIFKRSRLKRKLIKSIEWVVGNKIDSIGHMCISIEQKRHFKKIIDNHLDSLRADKATFFIFNLNFVRCSIFLHIPSKFESFQKTFCREKIIFFKHYLKKSGSGFYLSVTRNLLMVSVNSEIISNIEFRKKTILENKY